MKRLSDSEYICVLESRIRKLEAQNEALKAEASDYLRKWVSAQETASARNMMLMLQGAKHT